MGDSDTFYILFQTCWKHTPEVAFLWNKAFAGTGHGERMLSSQWGATEVTWSGGFWHSVSVTWYERFGFTQRHYDGGTGSDSVGSQPVGVHQWSKPMARSVNGRPMASRFVSMVHIKFFNITVWTVYYWQSYSCCVLWHFPDGFVFTENLHHVIFMCSVVFVIILITYTVRCI